MLVFFIKLSGHFDISGNEILMNETGQVGDFIGGLVGSIWALAGVLLFFSALKLQREEFRLQRQEFQEQRLEFMTNRITNIIYKQKEVLENQLYDERVELKIGTQIFKGIEVINHYREKRAFFAIKGEYTKLPDEYKEIVDSSSDFFFDHHGEQLLSVIHSSFYMLFNFITEKDDKENYILNQYTRRQLFTLMRSMYRFREIEEFIKVVRAVWFYRKQNFVGIPSALEHFNRIENLADDIRELTHKIITDQLGESKYEYGDF